MQNRVVEMRKGLRKSLVLFPAVDYSMQYVNICQHELIYHFFILCILLILRAFFSNFLLWKNYWIFCFCYKVFCRCGNNHFDVHFWRIFWKVEKTRSMIEEMDREVFIFSQSRHYSFIDITIRVLFPFCILNWHVNNYASGQGRGVSTRNESTLIFLVYKIINFLVGYSNFYC